MPGQFFAQALTPVVLPGQRHLCLDGKTLKETIPLVCTQDVHLVASCWHKSR